LTYWRFIVIIIRSVTEQTKTIVFKAYNANDGTAVAYPQRPMRNTKQK